MAIYSRLDGTAPVSSASGGVWKIQKKRKTGERQRHNEKKRERGKEEQEASENLPLNEGTEITDGNGLENEEQIGYGSAKQKKRRMPRKIDLTI